LGREACMLKHILVPLDGSAQAELALPHAVALAALFDAVVVLLRVAEADDPGHGGVDPIRWRLTEQRGAEYIQRIAADLTAKGVRTRWEVTVGKPAEQIVDYARLNDIDLIVFTTHGRGDATAFALGGTAHQIAEGAGVSIMLVPAAKPSQIPAEGVCYRRIVVPVDGSTRGDWAVSLGAGIARRIADGELILVHAIPEAASLAPSGTEEQRLADVLVKATRARVEQKLRDTVADLSRTGVTARYRIAESSHTAAAISDIAKQEGADLTLLVAHGSAAEARLAYGSVCAGLLALRGGVTLVLQDQPTPGRVVEPAEPCPSPRALAARL